MNKLLTEDVSFNNEVNKFSVMLTRVMYSVRSNSGTAMVKETFTLRATYKIYVSNYFYLTNK